MVTAIVLNCASSKGESTVKCRYNTAFITVSTILPLPAKIVLKGTVYDAGIQH